MREPPERDRALGQTMTWGTAGVGVVILTTVVAARTFNPATLVATAAFALAIPFLVVLGLAYAIQNDHKAARPPTTRDSILLINLIYAAQFVFYFGLAALLWGYDPRPATGRSRRAESESARCDS